MKNKNDLKELAKTLTLTRKALLRAQATGYGVELARAMFDDALAAYEAAE